jgi:hypothetical protein
LFESAGSRSTRSLKSNNGPDVRTPSSGRGGTGDDTPQAVGGSGERSSDSHKQEPPPGEAGATEQKEEGDVLQEVVDVDEGFESFRSDSDHKPAPPGEPTAGPHVSDPGVVSPEPPDSELGQEPDADAVRYKDELTYESGFADGSGDSNNDF